MAVWAAYGSGWPWFLAAARFALLGKIKETIHEGNIRRITIKKKSGETVMEIPMTLGVVGALIAPQLAAIGAIAALVTEATVVVEKVDE